MPSPTIKLAAILSIICALSSTSSARAVGNKQSELNDRYHSRIGKCKDEQGHEHPAYKCSGIIIRGINSVLELPHFWSLKPANKQKRAFSAGFLRNDARFSEFPRGYDSGFIMYPHLQTPPGKTVYEVLCAFPSDGGTDRREGRGCGKATEDIVGESGSCEENGIVSLPSWTEHYDRTETSSSQSLKASQCAFNMTSPSAADLFKVTLQANHYLTYTGYAYRNNELRFESWDEEKVASLPIEALFYINGSEIGLSRAKDYQRDFFEHTKETLPIVSIQLPGPGRPFFAGGDNPGVNPDVKLNSNNTGVNPGANPGVNPDVKLNSNSTGVNPGANPGVNPGVKLNSNSTGVNPGANPAVKLNSNNTGVNPGANPGVNPAVKLNSNNTGANPDASPGVSPDVKLNSNNSGANPGANSGVNPGVKPDVKLDDNPAIDSGAKPGVNPGANSQL